MRRSPVSIAVVAVLVLIVIVGVVLRIAAVRRGVPAATTAPPAEQHARAVDALPTPGAPEGADFFDDAQADGDAPRGFNDPAHAWASVYMDAIRKALPDNTYWKMAVPTKDPDVLRARDEERERWNVEYGKVLSGNATAEEVDAYYEQRRRLSQDYLEFIVYLLTNYGYQIPPRDVAALKLAAEMHNARLEEIPRQLAEAHERRAAHEEARRAWIAQQKAFAGTANGSSDTAGDAQ